MIVEDHASIKDDDFARALAARIKRNRRNGLSATAIGLLYMALSIWRPIEWNKFIMGMFASFSMYVGLSALNSWWNDRWLLRTRTANFAAGRNEAWHDVDSPVDEDRWKNKPPRPAEWIRRVYDRHGYDASRRAFEVGYFRLHDKIHPREGGAERIRRDAEAKRANVMIAKACHAEALAAWTNGCSETEVVYETEVVGEEESEP